MNGKEYWKGLANVKGSRLNEIIRAVNGKVPKDEIDLKSDVEEMFYDRTWKHASDHEKKYGKWPAFDMVEVETDDPVLDIYSESADDWAKVRKSRHGIDEIDEE